MLEEIRKLRRRVVVTGHGAVTPLAPDVEGTWSAMLAGRSGVRRVQSLEVDDLQSQIAGEVRDFDPDAYIARNVSRRMDLYAQYALCAAIQAVESSKLTIDARLAPRAGVLMGSGYGANLYNQSLPDILREKGPRRISPFAQVAGAIDNPVGEISMQFGVKGPTRALSTACATGSDSVGEAARWIQLGVVDAAIAGGADNCITRIDLAASGNAKALSTRNDAPQRASRPFDEERDGFVMSAGAGAVVLEEAEHAMRRGAHILGEVVGYASTSDAHHWTAPHPEAEGAKAAMRGALEDAGIAPADVDYINAHGTSTPVGDEREVAAIREVYGEHAPRIPVSSTKSMTGHMIGASGAVELIACMLAMRDGVVPPTINCEHPLDEEMNFVPTTPQHRDTRIAMSNSFGFGGRNAVLVVRRWEAEGA
ncbi:MULTISPECIES: beta-ketoacyl-ACP synthase II [Prauserella salsuginis group]|uniref:3-oxoacyl-[acyl-carrier-protein] synthase 2 n=1 Tax=Prauserella salsuginis TaxID=387889 RepID=A0ABW6G7F8_9PSEU|nr:MULTISPECIES: beta-ketoacyl-ACP synthase II [Prauserella salsuginis group]MCR3719509.1 3-oxoacyl-[acyl-carrier-protein] synthase II [Prauserella flava]MCR3735477.1 3-oxoacyl-[acyl-carrier-protein] synthase II [Prauserella salsuginis]